MDNEEKNTPTGEAAEVDGNVDPSRGDSAENLLRFLAGSLLPNQDTMSIKRFFKGDNLKLTLEVAGPNLGKVIGKGGRIANSIRTLVQVAGAKNGLETYVEFSDGRRGPKGGGNRRPYGNRGPRPPRRRPSN